MAKKKKNILDDFRERTQNDMENGSGETAGSYSASGAGSGKSILDNFYQRTASADRMNQAREQALARLRKEAGVTQAQQNLAREAERKNRIAQANTPAAQAQRAALTDFNRKQRSDLEKDKKKNEELYQRALSMSLDRGRVTGNVDELVSYLSKKEKSEANEQAKNKTDFIRQQREELEGEKKYQLENPEDIEQYRNQDKGTFLHPTGSGKYLWGTKAYYDAKQQEAEDIAERAPYLYYNDPDAKKKAAQGAGSLLAGALNTNVRGKSDNSGMMNYSTRFMTEEQKNIMNYLIAEEGIDSAMSYRDSLLKDLNQKSVNDITEKSREFSSEHPLIGTGVNALASLGSGAGYVDAVLNMDNDNRDTNNPAYWPYYIEQSTREGIKENQIPLVGKGASDFLVDTGLSMTQNIARLPIGEAGLAVAGLGAATGGYFDALERGGTNNQALAFATASGVDETFFETFSLENLKALKAMPPTSAKMLIKNVLKQSFTEGSEEVFTDFANAVFDKLVMGDNSEYDQRKQSYMDQGMSKWSSVGASVIDFGKQLGLSYAGGALSGAVMGGGAQALGTWQQGQNSDIDYKNINELAESIPDDRSAYETEEDYNRYLDLRALAEQYVQQNVQTENQVDTELDESQQDSNQETGKQMSTMEKGYLENAIQNAAEGFTGEITEENPDTEEDLDFLAKGFEKNGAETIKELYAEKSEDVSATEFMQAYAQAYNTGRYNVELSDKIRISALNVLDEEQFRRAQEAGMQDRNAAQIKQDPETLEFENLRQSDSAIPGTFMTVEQASKAQNLVGEAVSRKYGLNVRIVNDANYEGSYEKGTITLNVQSGNFLGTVNHEMGHFIKEYSPDLYQIYQDHVIKTLSNTPGFDLEQRISQLMDRYEAAGQTLTRAEALDEIVNNAAESFMNDTEYLQQLAVETQGEKTLREKIVDFLNDVIDAIKSLIKKSSRSEAKALEQNLESLEDARAVFFAGAEEAGQRYKDGYRVDESDSGVKQQLDESENSTSRVIQDKNGNRVTVISEKMFSKNSIAKNPKRAEAAVKALLEELNGEKVTIRDNGAEVEFDLVTADEYTGSKDTIKLLDDRKTAKLNASIAIKSIVENSKYWRFDKNRKIDRKVNADRGFDYYQCYFAFEGENIVKYYGILNVRKDINGIDYVYDITNTKKQGSVAPIMDESNSGQKKLSLASGNIADQDENVNNSTKKNARNKKRNKTRFQLEEPVEETGNLIAVHNLNSDKLMKMLQYDGIPMPSIAVTKADIGHENFGDISLVFTKDTIDPKMNRKNKVYAADAWTPTFPRIEYDLNSKVEDSAAETIQNLVSSGVDQEYARQARTFTQSISDKVQYGGENSIVESAMSNSGLKAAYLKSIGQDVESVQKTVVDEMPESKKSVLAYIIDQYGEEIEAWKKQPIKDIKDQLEEAYTSAKSAAGASDQELKLAHKRFNSKNPQLTVKMINTLFNDLEEYQQTGGRTEQTVVDYAATNDAINQKINEKAYRSWVENLYDGIISEEGIRNGKDRFTPSGTRRSFKQLHYAVTAENIVKSMMSQSDDVRNVAGFYGIKSIRAVAADEFKSIDQIRKASGKLQDINEAEYTQRTNDLSDRLDSVMRDIVADKNAGKSRDTYNELMQIDTLGNGILEAAANPTEENIKNVLNGYWWNIRDAQAAELASIIEDVRDMPVNMFEAKPQRVVGYNEIAAAVVPSDADENILNALNRKGIRTIMYDPEQKNSRKSAVNALEGVRFQLEEMNLTESDHVLQNMIEENKALKEERDALAKQLTLTSKEELQQIFVQKTAQKFARKYNSTVNQDTLARNIMRLYEYARSGSDADAADLQELSMEVAGSILKNSQQKDTALTEQYKDLRKQIRDTQIAISDQDKADLAQMGGYGNFRKRYFGKMKLGKDGISVDTLYQELSGQYPDLFDINVTHPADQLMQIGNVIDTTEPQIQNPYHANMDEMKAIVGHELMEEYFNGRQPAPTMADQMAADVQTAKRRYNKAIKDFQEKTVTEYEDRINRLKNENRALRDQASVDLLAQQSKFNERLQKQRDSVRRQTAKKAVVRDTNQLQKWLLSPTDSKHIPQGLRGTVADFLNSIDMSSNQDTDTVITQKTQNWIETSKNLQAIIDNEGVIFDDDGNQIYLDVDPDLAKRIDDLRASVKDIDKLDNLDAYRMEELQKVVASMKKMVTEANSLKSNRKSGEVSIIADGAHADMKNLKTRKEFRGAIGHLDKLLNYDMLDANTFFGMMGENMHSLHQEIRDGQDKKTIRIKESADYIERMMEKHGISDKELKEWMNPKEKPKEFTTGAGKISLTPAQVMSLYELNKRGQARGHIYSNVGGIKSSETVDWNDAVRKSIKPLRVSELEVETITNSLSPKQKAFADALQQFMGIQIAGWGNETTMEMYGYNKFTSRNYFPIKTDDNFLATRESDMRGGNTQTVKNLGITKATVNRANNPIIVENIFDVFTRQVDQMSTYNAFLIPLSDMQKVYNYKDQRGTADGSTIKQDVDRVFGKNGVNYISRYLTDVNGSINTDRAFSEGLIGNMKAAAVSGNLRVAIQQPTAFFRAMDDISPKYLARGAFTISRSDQWETICKYAPVAQWKDWGFVRNEVGPQLKSVLFANTNLKDEIVEKLSTPASMGDQVTWQRLWRAVEYETMDLYPDLKEGTDEFYQKCGERFSQIVDDTQVADSVIARTQIMRSTNKLDQFATAFMAEPLKSYNMLYRAGWDIATGKKGAKAKATRTAATFVANAVATALAASAMDALRDKDKEKSYGDRYLGYVKENALDNINVFQLIPYIKDVLSIVQGYSVSRTDMSWAQNLKYAGDEWIKFQDGKSKYTAPYVAVYSLRMASNLTGIPFNSVLRDLEAAVDEFASAQGGTLEYKNMRLKYAMNDNNLKSYVEMMYEAEKSGDTGLHDMIRADLEQAGFSDEEIDKKRTNLINNQIKKDLDVTGYAESYASGNLTREDMNLLATQYIEMKIDGGMTEKKAVQSFRDKLTKIYKPMYQEAKTQAEREAIIKKCNVITYNGKSVYEGYKYSTNWKKK
jgi:hypothetical protein